MSVDIEHPAPGNPPPAQVRRKHPVRKWLLRILAGVLILLLLAAICIQIVLWTGVPKSIAVGQVEKGMGLRLGVSGFSTGWLGHTTLKGVKVALPLSSQAFLDVPEMKVSHTNLLGLLLGWPIQIKSVEIDDAVVYVRQAPSGRWNLQQVATLLARTLGSKNAAQTTASTSATAALPSVKIRKMTIDVVDNQNRQAKVYPINVDGSAETPVSWKYDVEIPSSNANTPPRLSLLGRVAPGGDWAHDATVWVHDINPWVKPWVPQLTEPVTVHSHWTGALAQGGVSGFLEIAQAAYGPYHATGSLTASEKGSVVSVDPENLVLQTPIALAKEIRVPTGAISYDGQFVRMTQLQLGLFGGPVVLNGWYEPALRQGDLQAWWKQMTAPFAQIKSDGKLHFAFSQPAASATTITADLSTRGSSSEGPFEAVVNFGAEGDSLQDLNWHLDAPALAWYRAQQLILDGLSARGTVSKEAGQSLVRLNSISLPQANHLSGTAVYALSGDHSWDLHLQGQDWPVRLIEGTALAFALDASGKSVPGRDDPHVRKALVTLERFFLRGGDADLSLNGSIDTRKPKPVQMDVTFLNQPGALTRTEIPGLIRGSITGRAHLAGVLDLANQTSIDVKGFIESQDAIVLGHPLGEIRADVLGTITNEQAAIHADGIPFLGGTWNLGAAYITHRHGRPVYTTGLSLSVANLPLERVSQFLQTQTAKGTFDGNWTLTYPGLKPDPDRMSLEGGGAIHNLAASDFVADLATFKSSLKSGHFELAPVRVTRGTYGRIDGSANFNLSDWRRLYAGARFTAFPINVPSARLGLQLWGGTDYIEVLLPQAGAKDPAAHKLRVNTDLNLRSAVTVNQQPEGEVRIAASMHGRVMDLRELRGDVLGGTIDADAVADIDQLTAARASFAWENLQSDRFVRLYPQLKGFGGTYSGSVRLAPATVPRALEPLALDIELRSNHGHWRTVQLGNGEIHAYVGPDRVIGSNNQPSSINLGGGAVDLWFASTRHPDVIATPGGGSMPVGVTVSNQLNLTLRALEADQFVRAFDPTHPPGFGRVGGDIFLLSAPKTTVLSAAAGSLAAPPPTPVTTAASRGAAPPHLDLVQQLLRTTTVDGKIQIGDSDLGNFGPISFLYNAMHLGGNVRTPTGRGNASFHMEDGRFHVSHLYYFNRGIEVRAVATVDQTWDLPNCPLHGSAVGTARPLKDIKLPLFAEVDAILSGLQGQLTSISFDNTLAHPGNFQLVSLNQLGSELRGIVLGEVGAK